MEKRVNLLKPDLKQVKKIHEHLKCHPILAALLVNRNLTTPSAVHRFIHGSLKDLRAPMNMPGMKQAVKRIIQAIEKKEHILIFGDYDVDGVTSTTILYEFLKYAGAEVSFYIPHRTDEGYDLKRRHIQQVAVADEVDLIITVDCGINSHSAVIDAKRHCIDVIVTDHHNPSDSLPPAISIINPKTHDADDGFEFLAGVGVAFFLVISLRKNLRDIGFWQKLSEPNLKTYCDLVALGTVADLVPVLNENRLLIKAGMEILCNGERLGLKVLSSACGINRCHFESDDIAFRLAPRLNAAGRMQHADIAVKLLTTSNEQEARQMAENLCSLNQQRQEMVQTIIKDIESLMSQKPDMVEKKAFVFDSRHWHEGVLGIVAARLVEKYYRPVILISTKGDLGKGSGRSISGFDLYKALSHCKSHLIRFGGHTMAAGLTIDPACIADFRFCFETLVQKRVEDESCVPKIDVDLVLPFDNITETLIDEIERLQPFGPQNPEPLFMAENVKILDLKRIGENHRRMVLCQPQGITKKQLAAIQFNIDPAICLPETVDRIIFRLRWNRWNGAKTVQLVIEYLETSI
jgi:single-stranded-DNA-specific exonuclease